MEAQEMKRFLNSIKSRKTISPFDVPDEYLASVCSIFNVPSNGLISISVIQQQSRQTAKPLIAWE